MKIGLVRGGFPEVRVALQTAMPDATVLHVPASDVSRAPVVDVLVPLGAQVGPELLDATRARVVQQFGVGLRGVDRQAAQRRSVAVANVAAGDTGNASAVAEMAMLHLLALLRHWHHARDAVDQRRVGSPMGAMLAGRTVTVLGVGAIGANVIIRLRACDAEPIGAGRRDRDADVGGVPLGDPLADCARRRVGGSAGCDQRPGRPSRSSSRI